MEPAGSMMARKPNIRTSYARDAAELGRLAEAVERDPLATDEWRAAVMSMLYEAADMLRRETLARMAKKREQDG